MGLFDSIKDYILDEKPKSFINTIPLEVISEKSRSLPVSVTSRRVEKGFNITDTTRREQQIIQITVVDNSKDYLKHREELEQLQAKGDYVTFSFAERDSYENMIIENIEEVETNKQKYGFTYHITLRQIQVATLSASDVKVAHKELNQASGNKIQNSAKTGIPTSREKQVLRKKTGLKNVFDVF